jgi:hypothetical protein
MGTQGGNVRFLSHSRNFSVQVIEPRGHATQYGDWITDREGYIAQFVNDDVTEADVNWAEEVFVKGGLAHGRTTLVDEVTPTPLINRLSVFDTEEMALRENWHERKHVDAFGNEHDFQKHVEDFLSRRAVDHPDFRQIFVEPIETPWPRYLDFRGTLDQLLEKIEDDGYDPARVLAYERQSGHRPAVIAALEKLVEEREQAPSVLA